MNPATPLFILENSARLLRTDDRPVPVPELWLGALVTLQNAILLCDPKRLQAECTKLVVDFDAFSHTLEKLKYAMKEGLFPPRYLHVPVFVAHDVDRLRNLMVAGDHSFDDPVSRVDAFLAALDLNDDPAEHRKCLATLDAFSQSFLSTATLLYLQQRTV